MGKIDVSDCKYLSVFDNKTCKLLLEKTETVKINTNMFDCINCPDCYYKQLKQSEQENAELKAEIETLKKVKDFACINLNNYIADNNKLKAENARLKEEKGGMQILIDNYIALTKNYQQTLQEIKAIAEELSCKHPEECFVNKPDWNGEVYGYDVAENWTKPSDLATCPSKLASAILQIITKAESEG